MIIDPETTWGDIQESLDNWDEPLQGSTNFFEMTREQIMSYPPDELVFPEVISGDEDVDDVSAD